MENEWVKGEKVGEIKIQDKSLRGECVGDSRQSLLKGRIKRTRERYYMMREKEKKSSCVCVCECEKNKVCLCVWRE